MRRNELGGSVLFVEPSSLLAVIGGMVKDEVRDLLQSRPGKMGLLETKMKKDMMTPEEVAVAMRALGFTDMMPSHVKELMSGEGGTSTDEELIAFARFVGVGQDCAR